MLNMGIQSRWMFGLITWVLWWTSATVWANMANPWRPTEPVGEPIGVMRQLSVLHEKLVLDFRPLVRHEPVRVTATYTIANQGQTVDVDLLFVTFGHNKGDVTLDGRLLQTRLIQAPAVPPEWKWPSSQAFLGVRVPKKLYGMQFKASIPAGKHTVTVTYTTTAGQHHSGEDMYRWYVLGYILAPAKRWAAFQKLDIQVMLPKRWRLLSSLPLQRKKHEWVGSFNKVPADFMFLRAQKIQRPWNSHLFFAFLGLLISVCFTVFFLWHHAHSTKTLKRTGMQMIWPLVAHLLIAVVISVGLTLGGIWAERWVVDTHQISQNWNYSYAFLRMLLLLFAGGGTILVGIVAYLVGMRNSGGGKLGSSSS